jgi:hypothetical protein
MKVFLSFLLAILLSGAGAFAEARDIAVYTHPAGTIVATITDEPCGAKVMAVLKALGMSADGEVKDLRHTRVSKFFEETNLEACVLPKDEDGDHFVIDEKGRTGYLTEANTKELL